MSEPMTPEFYAKVRRRYRVDDLPEWRERPVSDLCDEIDRLRARVVELEVELGHAKSALDQFAFAHGREHLNQGLRDRIDKLLATTQTPAAPGGG